MSRTRSAAGMRVLMSVVMLVAVGIVMPLTALGAYVNWNPISGNGWELATNWIDGVLPGSGDIPCIGRQGANCEQPCVVTADGTVGGSSCYIAIDNYSGHLRILSGSLTIGAGGFVFPYVSANAADVVQSNGAVTVAGTIEMGRYGSAPSARDERTLE